MRDPELSGMLIGMIWILFVFLLLLQFGLYGAGLGSAIVLLAGVAGAIRRRWRPPNLGLNWIVAIWLVVALLGYAIHAAFDTETPLRFLGFGWIVLLYSLLFILERARPDEDDVWNTGFLFLGFAVWQIVLSFLPLQLDLSIVGLENQSIELLSPVSKVNSVFFALAMGYCLTQIRFFNRSKWLLLGATICMGAALIITDQSACIAAALIALFFMSFIFSFRLWLFLIVPLVGLGLLEEAGKLLQLGQSLNVTEILSAIRDIGFWGQGFGSATNVRSEFLRVLVETGWVGLFCFVLINAYFLRLGYKTWKVSSDRNAFNKGLSLGLLGAHLNLVGLSVFTWSLSDPTILAVSAMIWATQIWLAFETRVLRRPLSG